MEQIVLKKILTDNPRTYGDPIPFSFSIPQEEAALNGGSYNLAQYKYTTNKVQLGTDLNSLGATAGDRWQAFKNDGKTKLGFILRFNGTNDGGNFWMLYNEEIACYIMAKCTTGRAAYIAINYKYILGGDNLDECLVYAESLYNRRFEPFTWGMDNDLYSFTQFIYSSSDAVYLLTNSVSQDQYKIGSQSKMRYFSSWYKLITGEFYQKETLFAMNTADGRKFYFGRIISTTEKNKCVLSNKLSNFTTQLENEPSYGFSDLIYGSDVGNFVNQQWGQYVNFENGFRIGYNNPQWNKGNWPQWAYATAGMLSADGDKLLTQRILTLAYFNTGASGVTGFDTWYLSGLGAILSKTSFVFGNRISGYETNAQSVDIFISPEYNSLTYENFKQELSKISHTETEWKALLARVFFFVSTVTAKVPAEMRENYGYATMSGDLWGSFAYCGFSYLGQQEQWTTTYYSGDSLVRNDFSSGSDWGSVIDFVNPEDDKPEPPGPEPEKEEGRITIGTLAELSIENGTPFLGDDTKLSAFSFMKEYLEDFELFDEDIKETRGFLYPLTVKGTKAATLEHFRKRSAFTIKKHAKELENLWKIANTTFDPAYNVEEHITEELKKTGSDTLRDAIDSVKTTDNLGARSNSTAYGEQNTTATTGAQNTSNVFGQQSTETTQGKAGFNSSEYQKDQNSQTTQAGYTDSTNTGERTDSQNISAHTDTLTSQAVVDTHTTDFREDVHEQTYNNTVSRKYDRQGNVGTMSTPELLSKASDAVSVFDFYNQMYDLILSELAYYHDEGYDVMF